MIYICVASIYKVREMCLFFLSFRFLNRLDDLICIRVTYYNRQDIKTVPNSNKNPIKFLFLGILILISKFQLECATHVFGCWKM